MGIQFPPAYCFPFPTVLLYIVFFCEDFTHARCHVAHFAAPRHRCENEATYGKLNERSRPGSAVVCAVKLECGAIGE